MSNEIIQGNQIDEITENLKIVLQARGQAHGGHGEYLEGFTLLLNLLLNKKLKSTISKREANMIMICHKVARAFNANDDAGIEDTLTDIAGYALLGVLQEGMAYDDS